MHPAVRLSAALLCASALAAPTSGAAQAPLVPVYDRYPVWILRTFGAPTETFFTGDVTRAVFHGCHWTETCITSVYEVGIERATGIGAARSLLTRQTWNRPHSDPRVDYVLGVSVVAEHWANGILEAGVDDPSRDWDGPGPYRPPGTLLLGGTRHNYPGEWIARNVVGGIQWETANLNFGPSQDFRIAMFIEMRWPGCDYINQQWCRREGTLFARQQTLERFNVGAAIVTPEPSTWALLGTGLLTLGGIAARRRSAHRTHPRAPGSPVV